MNLRSLTPLAAAAGLCATATAEAQTPAGTNQQLAEAIAAQLTATGAANAADVAIGVENGVVTVTGVCKDAACKAGVIQAVRTVTGVKKVRDGLTVAGTGTRSGVVPVQAVEPLPIAAIPQAGLPMAPQALGNPPARMGAPMMGPVAGPAGFGAMPAMPGVGDGEPLPLGMAGAGSGDMAAPPLPPYAWPTYAPHNNVSRVGYPTAYPYNAFPFIGPFYPFPKVPLGWRKVLLEWEDGHWWIGKTQAPQDYWRVRFW